MEIVKTEDIKEKDSLSTIKVISGIKYTEQMNVNCDISLNQAGFQFIKCENSPEVGTNTSDDTEVRIKTEAKDEVIIQEHGVNYKYLRSIETEDYKIDIGEGNNVDISVREAGCVKCEVNPKEEEEEETTDYDTEMRLKTEIREEADVDHEVNYELLSSIKVEDYKIEPDQECMGETITDKRCILSNKLGFDNGQYVNNMEIINHEQIVGKEDTNGIVLCTDNLVQQCERNSCEYEYETGVEGNIKHLRCVYCSYITKYPTSLKIHFTTKHSGNAEFYQCSLCEYKTRYERYLLGHHKRKHDNATRILHCRQCDFKTKAKYSLLRHHRSKHDDTVEVFRCEQCDYKTKTKNYLLQHCISKHNAPELFHCELCNFKTKNKYSLPRHHKAMHSDASGIFHCELCDFKTKYRCNLLEHRALEHYDASDNFHCVQCDYKTKFKYNLLNHHRSKHAADAAAIHHCD